jgi:hypothetical protein
VVKMMGDTSVATVDSLPVQAGVTHPRLFVPSHSFEPTTFHTIPVPHSALA